MRNGSLMLFAHQRADALFKTGTRPAEATITPMGALQVLQNPLELVETHLP